MSIERDEDVENLIAEAMGGDCEARQAVLEDCRAELDDSVIDAWFKEAIAGQKQQLAFAIAVWYDDFRGDARKHICCLEQTAALGYSDAYYYLGEAYRKGQTVPRDYDRAMAAYLEVERMKGFGEDFPSPLEVVDDGSCPDVGVFTVAPLSPSEYDLEWWIYVEAHRPSPILEYYLGEWFWGQPKEAEWTDGKQDKVRALALYTHAAEQGLSKACLRLSYLYATDGAIKDFSVAVTWLRKAEALGCDPGLMPGRLNVIPQKIKLLEDRVANSHDLHASAQLAEAFMDGTTCPKDYEKVYRYARNLLLEDEDYGVFLKIMNASAADPGLNEVFRRLTDFSNQIEREIDEE